MYKIIAASTIALLSLFIPKIPISSFAPLLPLLYYKTSRITALWYTTLCGLIIDLLSSEARFGLYALSYCLTTALLYKQKHHFFEEKPTAFCLFATLISAVTTIIHIILLALLGEPFSLSPLFIIPILDSLYVYLGFICLVRAIFYLKHKTQRLLSRN